MKTWYVSKYVKADTDRTVMWYSFIDGVPDEKVTQRIHPFGTTDIEVSAKGTFNANEADMILWGYVQVASPGLFPGSVVRVDPCL